MGVMPVGKLLANMAIPMVISMLVQAMYNVVDSYFVAKISTDALTAISLAYPIQMLMIAVAIGTSVGMNSYMSRKLGEGNTEAASKGASNGLCLLLLSAIVFAIFGFVITPFFRLFTDDPQLIEMGVDYLEICMVFGLGVFIQIGCERILQSMGKTGLSMVTQLVGAVVNIILDPLMIFGIGPFPEMGVAGAAYATVIGQWVGMLMALALVFFKEHEVKISFKNFRLCGETVREIYRVGIPSIVMQSIGSIMIVGLNGILAASEASVTVLGVYYKLQSFVFMPCFGLNQGVMPIIGYNYGARNRKRVYSALKRGIIIGVIIMTLGTLAMWIIPEQLISMFGGTEELMKIGVPAFRIISLCFIPAAAGIIFTTLFQAVGKGMRSLIMSFARQLVLILPIAFIFSRIWGIGAVWYAFPIAEIFSLTIAICFFINLVKGDFKKLG